MIIQSERVWLSGGFYPATIHIENGRISNVAMGLSDNANFDFAKRRIIPGLIDSHAHGGWDYDTNENNPEGLRRWAANLPAEGVTAFAPPR
jgi:N-acetylglucosamine-6-phosphate deacetylase